MNMEKIKWILLAIFLIIEGLMLLGLGLGSIFNIIAGICALIAGVFFLINRYPLYLQGAQPHGSLCSFLDFDSFLLYIVFKVGSGD